MRTSEEIKDITAALAAAQRTMKNAALNKVNPHFRSKYADLAGIRDAVTTALTAQNIAIVQTLDVSESGGQVVLTRLLHTSGQWIESACPIPNVPDMQKLGSAITYARRYSLSAICGIAADEDDDGNAAVAATNGQQKAAEPKPDGFDKWAEALADVAPEGVDALKKVWAGAKPDFRTYMTKHHNEQWEALKAKAEKVKVPVHA